ncbi:MAG: tRNA (adenosine(37)-N6)-threonylcarbamoyltransferase complex transferase subunit TsaD [Patescibacteria group bacterium]
MKIYVQKNIQQQLLILGIETSCDETAAAVISCKGDDVKILSNIISSQIKIHQKYGGVVPEVAAREHVVNILPVINKALAKANLFYPYNGLDAIAVTQGPGLITSLMVGVETAKTLAYTWQVPIVGINHIEGHIYANWLSPASKIFKSQTSSKSKIQNKSIFPVLILTVSGGHTMLVLMKAYGQYQIIGETRDDAAGEAFDKAAVMLNIGYPGGPAVAAYAAQVKDKEIKNQEIHLPRPMIYDKNYEFSFSGLKTALFYALQRDKKYKEKIPEYCAEFQQAVVDVLIAKTIRAAETLNCQTIMLSGGVAANKELRNQLDATVKTKLVGVKVIIPEVEFCTDNAAMIATAGYFKIRASNQTISKEVKSSLGQLKNNWAKLQVNCNLEL